MKSILITGCSSGIGYDAAHALAKRGWRVFATCRQQKDADRLVNEGLEALSLDYADAAGMKATVTEIFARTGGRLDALFNNGAYAIPGAVEDLPREAMRAIFEVNLFGQFELIRHVLPAMKAQGSGRIINCSSVLGIVALRMRGAYIGTKFAMEGMTDALRFENHASPIHFSLIEPGPIATRIRENAIPHFERWIDWEGSAHREIYATELRPRLYAPSARKDRFELQPSAVTAKLVHALESRKPRARYFVTTPTYFARFAKRFMPDAWSDALFRRQ
ncbi:MAG: SDR family NAD(P)-dependent oxidoreductase [Paracoccaceae bacterium]